MRAQKLPVQVECMRLTAPNEDEVAEWCGGIPTHAITYSMAEGGYVRNVREGGGLLLRCEPRLGVVIPTREGAHLAEYGDIVIRGVDGEFYPCKPEIFAKTYELVCPHDPTCADLSDCSGV